MLMLIPQYQPSWNKIVCIDYFAQTVFIQIEARECACNACTGILLESYHWLEIFLVSLKLKKLSRLDPVLSCSLLYIEKMGLFWI